MVGFFDKLKERNKIEPPGTKALPAEKTPFPRNMDVLSRIKNFKLTENRLPDKKFHKIAFIIPDHQKYSGGHTSILRLGTFLAEFGHEVFYITYAHMSEEEMNANARFNLPYFKGTFRSREALESDTYDIGIATLWMTAYHLLAHADNFRYKAYFIQDYEPYFYPEGEFAYLARYSYQLGFKMISLGQWNKTKIEQLIADTQVEYVNFPIELGQYEITSREIKINRNICFAVYVKDDPKRAPEMLTEQLVYLEKRLKEQGYKVKIFFFGLESHYYTVIGKNLGRLTHDEIIRLYKKAHFGIVVSLTNISLVNYEMLAMGLPVIDYRIGSAPSFFTDKEAIFIDWYPEALFNKVQYYIENQDELNHLIATGQKKLSALTWEKASKQFAQHLGISGNATVG